MQALTNGQYVLKGLAAGPTKNPPDRGGSHEEKRARSPRPR